MSDIDNDAKLEELAEAAVEIENAKVEAESIKDSGQVPREVLNKEIEKRRTLEARIEVLEREKLDVAEQDIERRRKLDEESGEFKKVIGSQRSEIEQLKSELTKARMDVQRLQIGRTVGLPDEVAVLIPGDDPDIIRNNAEKLADSVKTRLNTGTLDAGRRSTSANNQGRTHHSVLDNAI